MNTNIWSMYRVQGIEPDHRHFIFWLAWTKISNLQIVVIMTSQTFRDKRKANFFRTSVALFLLGEKLIDLEIPIFVMDHGEKVNVRNI